MEPRFLTAGAWRSTIRDMIIVTGDEQVVIDPHTVEIATHEKRIRTKHILVATDYSTHSRAAAAVAGDGFAEYFGRADQALVNAATAGLRVAELENQLQAASRASVPARATGAIHQPLAQQADRAAGGHVDPRHVPALRLRVNDVRVVRVLPPAPPEDVRDKRQWLADFERKAEELDRWRGRNVGIVLQSYLPDALPIPTLVVWGSRDRMIPAWHAITAQRSIPGCRVELFEGAGHFPHLDEPADRTVVLDDVDRPHLFVAEEAAGRHLEHVLARRHDDPDLDPVAIADVGARLGRIDEIDDGVDPLLFDPERRDLCEARRLDESDPPVQRVVASPLFDEDRLPRLDLDGGADAAAGVRRARRKQSPERPGLFALDRTNARWHPSRHTGHRQGGRNQCGAARGRNPGQQVP